jgi:hypothetical protein
MPLTRAPVAGRRPEDIGAGRTETLGLSSTDAEMPVTATGRVGAALAARPRDDAGGSGGGTMGMPAGGDSVTVVAFARLIIAASPASCDSAKSRAVAPGEPIVAESAVAWSLLAWLSSSSEGQESTRPACWRRRQAAAAAGPTRDSWESWPVTLTEQPADNIGGEATQEPILADMRRPSPQRVRGPVQTGT